MEGFYENKAGIRAVFCRRKRRMFDLASEKMYAEYRRKPIGGRVSVFEQKM